MNPYDEITADHRRLFVLVQAAIHDVEHSYPLSPAQLAPLSRCLRTHFRFAEEVIFPTVERLTEVPAGTAALRRELQVMGEYLGEMEAALAAGGRAEVRGTLLELAAALRLHCQKVEETVCPLMERWREKSAARTSGEHLGYPSPR